MNRTRTPEVCLFSFLAESSLLAASRTTRPAALSQLRQRTQRLIPLALLIAAAALAALLAGCGSSKSSTQSSTLGDGTYVFHLAGVDYALGSTSPYFVAGAFTVSKGLITQGEEDFVDFNGVFSPPQATIEPAQSGIQLTADGNLQITLYTGNESPI